MLRRYRSTQTTMTQSLNAKKEGAAAANNVALKKQLFQGNKIQCVAWRGKKGAGFKKGSIHSSLFFSSQKNHGVISEHLCGSWTLKVPETKLIKNSSMQVARCSCCGQPLSLKWNREVLHSGSGQHRCLLLFIILGEEGYIMEKWSPRVLDLPLRIYLSAQPDT